MFTKILYIFPINKCAIKSIFPTYYDLDIRFLLQIILLGPGPPLSWHDGKQRPRLILSHPGGQPPPQPQQHRHPSCQYERRHQETASTEEKRLLHLRAGHDKTTPGLPVQVCWVLDDRNPYKQTNKQNKSPSVHVLFSLCSVVRN